MTQKNHIETRQSCGHVALWSTKLTAPKVGERIYCRNCDDMRVVVNTPGGWYARCLSPACTWRLQRVKVEYIHAAITQHLEQNRTHTVFLTDFMEEQRYRITRGESPVTHQPELALFEL